MNQLEIEIEKIEKEIFPKHSTSEIKELLGEYKEYVDSISLVLDKKFSYEEELKLVNVLMDVQFKGRRFQQFMDSPRWD